MWQRSIEQKYLFGSDGFLFQVRSFLIYKTEYNLLLIGLLVLGEMYVRNVCEV